MEQFEIARGTILGRDHRIIGKNNQDAFNILKSNNMTICLVCDGCGSGKYSEVGAKIGARIIAESILRDSEIYKRKSLNAFPLNEKIRENVLAQIRVIALSMGGSFSETITDYFLFTVVGAILTPLEAIIFSIGDGVIIINGEEINLSFPDDTPPYLSYELTGSSLLDKNPNYFKFQIHEIIPIGDIRNILIGTDGTADFINKPNKNIPGKKELIGPISQFWQENRYFNNKDMIRRKLALANRDSVKYLKDNLGNISGVHKENGLLPDDTTMVVIRRKGKKKLFSLF